MKEQIPSLLVKERIQFKKTQFQCDFFDGYAKTTYDNLQTAEASYKNMKSGREKVKLEGNVIIQYKKGKTAQEIKDLYLKDIHNAMIKNGVLFKVSYEEIIHNNENEKEVEK
jgi:hypothetical protein